MADVNKPKTRVENDKDADLPRTQPESPKHEGIDPLTEGDTMYPAQDTKSESEKLSKKQANSEPDTSTEDKTAETVKDQNEVNAKANTPDDLLPNDNKTPDEVKANRPAESKSSDGKASGSATSSR